eukprot:982956-Pelagomonas_calceolata.AAC.1
MCLGPAAQPQQSCGSAEPVRGWQRNKHMQCGSQCAHADLKPPQVHVLHTSVAFVTRYLALYSTIRAARIGGLCYGAHLDTLLDSMTYRCDDHLLFVDQRTAVSAEAYRASACSKLSTHRARHLQLEVHPTT